MTDSNCRHPACKAGALPTELIALKYFGDPYGIRTRVAAVKGRCLRPLDQRAGQNNGWGGWIRTNECQSQSLVPYRLATPQCLNLNGGQGWIRTIVPCGTDLQSVAFNHSATYPFLKTSFKVSYFKALFSQNRIESLS